MTIPPSSSTTSLLLFDNMEQAPPPLQQQPQEGSTNAATSGTSTATSSMSPSTSVAENPAGIMLPAKEPVPAKSSVVRTDKPRPHVCQVCTRSFARLEHLKRHERSHTKEKPFQCPVCERCFARRDLLLRHKQKLHANFGEEPLRRGSVKKVKGNEAKDTNRKGSAEAATPAASNEGNVTAASSNANNSSTNLVTVGANEHNNSGAGAAGTGPISSTTQPYSNLLRTQLHPHHRHLSFSAASASSYSKVKDVEALRANESYPTGPPQVGFSTPQLIPTSLDDTAIDDMFSISDPLFINPQLLDRNEDGTKSIFKTLEGGIGQHRASSAGLIGATTSSNGSGHHHNDNHNNHHNFNEAEDLSPNSHLPFQSHDEFHMWDSTGSLSVAGTGADFGIGSSRGLQTGPPSSGKRSAANIFSDNLNGLNGGYSPSPSVSAVPPHVLSPHPSHVSTGSDCGSSPGLEFGESVSSAEPGHLNGDWMRHASISNFELLGGTHAAGSGNGNGTHVASGPAVADPLTILNNALDSGSFDLHDHQINHHNGLNLGTFGQDSAMNASMSHINISEAGAAPHLGNYGALQGNNHKALSEANFSQVITPQLRLHVLTLLSAPTPFSASPSPRLPSTADLQRYINAYNSNFGRHFPFLHHTITFNPDNVPLALGMAAIGALYVFEPQVSMAIFEISRSCIHVYLESRRERRTLISATPLWLVQALILGVIYGLFSSETDANDIAVEQAKAVVSLAKSAGLHFPVDRYVDGITAANSDDLHCKWAAFIEAQSRIRTMHVVHIVSCLVATSHNITSSLKNTEVLCGCPCDESLWNALSANEWWDIMVKKELVALQLTASNLSFTECLSQLCMGNTLMAKVSQFTLLSLMYALHLEILDRRRNNDNKDQQNGRAEGEQGWQVQKAQLENILRAWETTWSLSPLASLSPSSQYGPIMSDAIPLSSLAHVRVYIDLRQAKEAFWKRDFNLMNRELDMVSSSSGLFDAASYAADAISLWEKHAVKWTPETTTTQTFIHTLVALFDCGLAVSEYLRRLDARSSNEWAENERLLVNRIGKIFYRVIDIVGYFEVEDAGEAQGRNQQPLNEDGTVKDSSQVRLSNIALLAVSRILSSKFVWPYALVLSDALRSRSQHLVNNRV